MLLKWLKWCAYMQSIDIQLNVSKQYLTAFAALIFLTLILIFDWPLSIYWKLALACLTLYYSVPLFWRYGLLQSKHSIIRLRSLPDDGEWGLATPMAEMRGKLVKESTVTRFICILCFKIEGQYRLKTCVILKDSIGKEWYRRLLVWIYTIDSRHIER